MTFREARIADIPQIQKVRHSVKENVLSNHSLVTDAHCEEFITQRGKGWVCELDEHIVGFSIVDLKENNVWALFVHPDFEQRGVGKRLHGLMMDWYFEQTDALIWLSTEPGTRAESFYPKAGWTKTGMCANGETRFEMKREDWMKK